MLISNHRLIKLSLCLLTFGLFSSASVWAQDEAPDEALTTEAETAVETATDVVDASVDDTLEAAGQTIADVAAEAIEDVAAEAVDASEDVVTGAVDTAEDVVAGAVDTAEDVVTEAVETVEEAPTTTRRTVNRLGLDTSNEFSLDMSAPMALVPTAADLDMPDVTLPDADQDALLQDVLVRMALDPEDAAAKTERDGILNDLLAQAAAAVDANQMGMARRLQTAVRTIDSNYAGLANLGAAITARTARNLALADAAADITEGRYFSPPETNAYERYAAMLSADPENQAATDGMNTLLLAVIEAAKVDATAGDYEQSLDLLTQAEQIPLSEVQLSQARSEVSGLLGDVIFSMQSDTTADIDAGRYDSADTRIAQLVAVGADNGTINQLRVRLADARKYGSFSPGQEIQEAFTGVLTGQTPVMIVVPAGEFLMGSDPSVEDSSNNERPVHRVSFARGFAMAQHETTVAEFRLFVNDTGYTTDAEKIGKSRVYDEDNGTISEKERVNWRHDFHGRNADAELPVIHVSWNDAAAYSKWLADNTGRNYRLPSEAEFEYSTRAGTQSIYWWGDGVPEIVVTNVTGDRDKSASGRRWTDGFRRYNDGFWGPAPVANYTSNLFGLYDMSGNVSEWTNDCWHSTYVQAPTDGSAWVNPGCARRVIRGASWSSAPGKARSASRISSGTSSRFSRVGFRVARDL